MAMKEDNGEQDCMDVNKEETALRRRGKNGEVGASGHGENGKMEIHEGKRDGRRGDEAQRDG